MKKTKEMEDFERETGKQAIWRGNITEIFKKWQNGTDSYDIIKERISLYVKKDVKDEWTNFAKNNDYPTLSKLIREALEFFIEYKSKLTIKNKKIEISFLSSLSHELKEPLTLIKGYLQLIIEMEQNNLEDDLVSKLKNILGHCLILENKIIEHLDKFESQKVEEVDTKIQYDILLIEDDLEIVNLLTSYFKSIGISCKGVSSGFKALKELERFIPRLILLDIILPDINGYEVLKRIRTKKKISDIPIFFLTAIPRVEIEKRIQEFGVKGTIFKPFNLSDFNIIQKYLNDGK